MNEKKLLVPVRLMALFFLIVGSCEKSAVKNQQDEIVLKVQTQGPQLSLIDAITLERPETGQTLGRVRSITVLKDYIIIIDATRECVEVFDREGNYKWSIGSRGDGEGQYKRPFELAVIPNTAQMLIWDSGTRQALRFSIQGEFLGQLKQPDRHLLRLLSSEDHNLIHTYVDRNKNGMLCVTSLDTGEDIARFKVCDVQYERLFVAFQRFQGLAYDEAQRMIYFLLPWEEKVMRIDLATQKIFTPITINHPKFISLKLDEEDDRKDVRKLFQSKFSRLDGMYLLSSGDILLRYMFHDSSRSTALILLSNLNTQPYAQEMKNELGYNVFTCYGESIYMYSSSADDEDTNGSIRVYRLTAPQGSPTG